MTREQAVQRWPVVPNADHRIPSVARSRSASASTTTPFLPPSSSETRFSRRAARSAICVPVAELPVNETTATSGLSTIALPTSAPAAGHEVDDARREPGLGHQLDQERRAVRRVRRRLEDHDVAGDQGRHHLPARDGHREVPGRDDPGDAKRLADAHRPLVGELRGDRLAGHPAAFAGHQVGDVDPFLDVAARLGQDLAHLAGHRPGEPLLVLGHERPEGVQDLAALGGGGPLPHRPGRPGGADRHRHVGRATLLEPPDDVAGVGRVAALERRAGGGIAPLPGDEVAEGRRVRRGVAGRGCGVRHRPIVTAVRRRAGCHGRRQVRCPSRPRSNPSATIRRWIWLVPS